MDDSFFPCGLGEQRFPLGMTITSMSSIHNPKAIGSPQLCHPSRRDKHRQVHRMSQELRPCIYFINVDHYARAEENGVVGGLVECERCDTGLD